MMTILMMEDQPVAHTDMETSTSATVSSDWGGWEILKNTRDGNGNNGKKPGIEINGFIL